MQQSTTQPQLPQNRQKQRTSNNIYSQRKHIFNNSPNISGIQKLPSYCSQQKNSNKQKPKQQSRQQQYSSSRYQAPKSSGFNRFHFKNIIRLQQEQDKKQLLKKSYLYSNNFNKNQISYSNGNRNNRQRKKIDIFVPSFHIFAADNNFQTSFNNLLHYQQDKDNNSNNKLDTRPKSQSIAFKKKVQLQNNLNLTKKQFRVRLNQSQQKPKSNKDRQQQKQKQIQKLTEIYWKKNSTSAQIRQQLQFAKQQRKQSTKCRSKNVQSIIRRKSIGNFLQAMAQYCRRMKIQENSRIFIFNSADVWMKQALLSQGWVQNIDIQSKFYHLKWSYKLNSAKVSKGQLVNHFYQSDLLTSKVELAKHIKNSAYMRRHAPKTFDLGNQVEQFIQNYNQTQLLCGLKKIIQEIQSHGLVPQWIIKKDQLNLKLKQMINKQNYEGQDQINNRSSSNSNSSPLIIHIPFAVQICAYCQRIRCDLAQDKKEDCYKLTQKTIKSLINFSYLDPPYSQYSKSSSCLTFSKQGSRKLPQKQKDEKKTEKPCCSIHFNCQNINLYSSSVSFKTPSLLLIELLYSYHEFLRENFGTYSVEGHRNIWIVKNRNSSKGTGIYLYHKLDEILKKSQNRLAQKYIQNCSLYSIANQKQHKLYKYDLRVWVVVVSFNPLIAYFYQNFYCRLCSQQYDLDNLNQLECHLTNYSKNKGSFSNQKKASVFSRQQFVEISTKFMKITVEQANKHINKKLQKLILQTLTLYRKQIESQPQCFQLFGFDILSAQTSNKDKINKISQLQLQFFLLEVNLSPACEDREDWLSQSVRNMAKGLLGIVVEHDSRDKCRQNGWISVDL